MIRFHKEGYKIIVITFIIVIAIILSVERFVDIIWITKSIQVFAIVFLIIVGII